MARAQSRGGGGGGDAACQVLERPTEALLTGKPQMTQRQEGNLPGALRGVAKTGTVPPEPGTTTLSRINFEAFRLV